MCSERMSEIEKKIANGENTSDAEEVQSNEEAENEAKDVTNKKKKKKKRNKGELRWKIFFRENFRHMHR